MRITFIDVIKQYNPHCYGITMTENVQNGEIRTLQDIENIMRIADMLSDYQFRLNKYTAWAWFDYDQHYGHQQIPSKLFVRRNLQELLHAHGTLYIDTFDSIHEFDIHTTKECTIDSKVMSCNKISD